MRHRRWPLAALALLPSLSGCQERLEQEEPAVPFVFRSLNLRQQDAQGRPAWQLTSPEARYDLSRKVAQARALRGTIFSAGKPLYTLSATSGTVLNDGAVIQLEGQATLQRLGPQPLVVRARRVRWYPRQERMELDQRPTASDRDLQISANRAVFLINQDKLELRGNPELIRRLQPLADGRSRPPELVLKVASADWYPSSGQLSAPGPVRAIHRPAPGKPLQTLSAPFLRGNSIQQVLVLQAPVRFVDPGAKAQLLGGESTIQLQEQVVVSTQPFSGVIDKLQITGHGFELRSADALAVVAPGCVLRQPGESLRADRCVWNWTTQAIEARGSVVLKRQANDQTTRAGLLTGRMGTDGLAVFSSPGGRVQTQLQVPQGNPSQPGRRPPIAL